MKPLPSMPLKEVWVFIVLTPIVSKETFVEAAKSAKFFGGTSLRCVFGSFVDLFEPMIYAEH